MSNPNNFEDYENKDAKECFELAIQQGRLSLDTEAPNYAGNYMYMGTWGGKDTFKHIMTRRYDV